MFFNDRNWITTERNYRVMSSENEVTLKLLMPAFKKEDIQITLDDNTLSISAKRDDEVWGRRAVSEKFELSRSLNRDSITSKLEDGVLSVSFQQTPKQVIAIS